MGVPEWLNEWISEWVGAVVVLIGHFTDAASRSLNAVAILVLAIYRIHSLADCCAG